MDLEVLCGGNGRVAYDVYYLLRDHRRINDRPKQLPTKASMGVPKWKYIGDFEKKMVVLNIRQYEYPCELENKNGGSKRSKMGISLSV